MASTTFGAYKSEGRIVDRKGYNLHIGGLVEPTAAQLTTPGASAFAGYTSGDIPAGAICGNSYSINGSGATGDYINIAKGAASELLLGVAIDERNANDARPITLTWFGYVRLIAGTAGVTKGDFLCPDSASAYYGAAITWSPNTNSGASNAESNANVLAHEKIKFGKALTSAGVGEYFDAFVNFSGV